MKKKHTVITIRNDIHARFKARCKERGVGIQEMAEVLLEIWLKKSE